MPQDEREIRAGGIEQLHQEVLDLDVVVGPGEAQSGRSFERIPGRWR